MGRSTWFCWNGVLSTAVLYGSLALFTSILHNVFLLYYVETFVSIYKIDKVSFWVGETIFLIWNSFNDPLFGWLSDRAFLSSPQSGSHITSPEVVLKRLKALSTNGPLFALSFLAFWVAWARPGLQFLLCLCLYDGFPYHGGPPPQRPAGRPRRVRHGSHKPELLLLTVQRAGLLLRFYVLRLLGQRRISTTSATSA
ncbi:Transmembrane protein 180 [Oryzias melastigma]|uniref:Transmembrane protein 180 n=1 Tax=Oryzias melastigma TaxID=30732 RepID=A0A834FD81_ORYME|nr:Transmembrane protein 180 [Oryzias melastigma]